MRSFVVFILQIFIIRVIEPRNVRLAECVERMGRLEMHTTL